MCVGRKSEISQTKIDAIYELIRTHKFIGIVAGLLGKHENTIKDWINKGNKILEKNQELNDELVDRYLENRNKIQKIYEDAMEVELIHFKEKNNIENTTSKTLLDRFINEYNLKKVKEFEQICKENEENLINNYLFSEDEEENQKMKQYVKFSRAFFRGKIANTAFYQSNIDKHAATSINVGLSWKMLERIESDNYAEKPQKIDHSHNHNIVLIDLAKKAQKMIENKNKEENIIDGEIIS